MTDYKAEREQQWRVDLRKSIPAKDRTNLERVEMPMQDAMERRSNNLEVNLGLTVEMAVKESHRCLDCANPQCVMGCPVSVNIPKFIKKIEAQDFLGAASVIKETSTLPAICGRVCPQEKQCESQCFYVQKLKKPAVAIGYLERFAADYERESGKMSVPEVAAPNGIKVAAIGSGPASLAWAADMAKFGYDVTVYEALHEIGGVLKYGIPEFRLPKKIVDAEINNLTKMGVKFVANTIIGRTITLETLRERGFKAFFIAAGAGLPRFMNIPGENSNGIFSSNEYLTRVNLMHAADPEYDTPVLKGKNIIVVGGGNTAMDSVRTAKRLGAEHAMIVYRRSESEMPARLEEVHHAMQEGVEFMTLNNPVEYIADDKGRVKQAKIQKMELGEPDASGRRSPVPVEGSEYLVDCEGVVVAVGVSPNPIITSAVEGLDVDPKRRTIIVNPENNQSNIPDIFAGGDIVRGGATVILAMGDGRKAAAGAHEWLQSQSK